MRLSRRRQPDLFEEPPNPLLIPNERRRATVKILEALLTESLLSEFSTQIRKEAQYRLGRVREQSAPDQRQRQWKELGQPRLRPARRSLAGRAICCDQASCHLWRSQG